MKQIDDIISKIEEMRTKAGSLFVVYVPITMSDGQMQVIQKKLTEATPDCRFIIVPDSIRIEILPTEGELAVKPA